MNYNNIKFRTQVLSSILWLSINLNAYSNMKCTSPKKSYFSENLHTVLIFHTMSNISFLWQIMPNLAVKEASLSWTCNSLEDHCATILNEHMYVCIFILAVHKYTVYIFSYKPLKYKESKLQGGVYTTVKFYAGLHKVVKACCYIICVERAWKYIEQIWNMVWSYISWPKLILYHGSPSVTCY